MSKSIITVTSRAITQFKKILSENNANAIKFGIKGGGCNGFTYDISSTNDKKEKSDELYLKDDLNVYVCGNSLFHILGTEIDWKNDIMGNYFVFNNPTASSSCGCGTSFDVK